MSREIKTETDMFGNKTEVVYENGSKVGEVQHRSGFLSGGDFIVENNGNTSRIVKNSALDPFTSPDTEIRDSSWNRTGRIEKSNTPHTRTIVDERSSGGSGGGASPSRSSGGGGSSGSSGGGGGSYYSGGGRSMPVAVPNNESVGEKIFYGIFGAIILGFFGLIIYADQLPNLKRSWEKQGDEAFAQGNYFEAAKFYTRIPDIEKDETFRLREGITADSLKVRGFRLIGQNDLEGAIARFDRSVNLRPGDHVTWGMRGYALQRDNDLEDALFSYEKALEIKPDYLPALTHKAEVLREQERYDEAVPVYWDCIGLDKTKGHIWSGKADCHFETGDFGLAADSYQKAIERSPEIKRNWLRRGESLYEIGKFRESIKLFDYVAKSGTSSQRKKSRFKRTKAYFKLGEKWNGIRAYMFNTTSEEI